MQIFGKINTIARSHRKRHNLTLLATVLVLATPAVFAPVSRAADESATVSDGARLMDRAVRQMAAWPSLEARFRQRANLYGYEAVGSGTYLQLQTPGGPMLRLEIKLQIDGQLVTLLQVCDGRFLWVRRSLGEDVSLGRVDLSRLDDRRQEGRSPLAPNWSGTRLALGGLPRLMAELRGNFQFEAPVAGRSGSTAWWMVRGQWKPSVLAKLLPDQAESIQDGSAADLSDLPRHLPTEVQIALRQEDLFPLRIDFRRSDRSSSKSAAEDTDAKSILVMDFFAIGRRDDLDPGQFTYQSGTQEIVDLTETYLQRP